MSNNIYFYVLNTPIGNLKDISFRFINIMYHMDVILTENKMNILKIFKHLGIEATSKIIISIRNFKHKNIINKIKKYLYQGFYVALCSDAGMPVINDPGNCLINDIRLDNTVPMEIIQGPSSLITSIISSGLICNRFVFAGFLPDQNNKRMFIIRNAFASGMALVVYDTPNNINQTLSDIRIYYGFSRVVIARELTKIYETFHYGILGKFIHPHLFYKGEMVILVEHSISLRSL